MRSGGEIISYALLIMTIISFIVTTKGKIKVYRNIEAGLFVCMGTALIYVPFANLQEATMSYVTRYLLFVPIMVLIINEFERHEKWGLFYTLSDIITLLSVVSIFGWLFTSVFQVIPNLGFVETEWGGIMHGNMKGVINNGYLYFTAQKSTVLGIPYRNCGIFCEGPAYAFVLSFALMTEMFLKDGLNKKRIIILWITMATTLTTSAVLYFVLFYALKWYLTNKTNRNIKKMLIPIMLVLFCVIINILLESKTNQASVYIRTIAYSNAFFAFLQKPLFGYGYKFDAASNFMTGITDSFSDVLTRGGICMTAYYMLPFLSCIISLLASGKKGYAISDIDDKNFVLAVYSLYVFFTVTLAYTFILLFLVSYGYTVMRRNTK